MSSNVNIPIHVLIGPFKMKHVVWHVVCLNISLRGAPLSLWYRAVLGWKARLKLRIWEELRCVHAAVQKKGRGYAHRLYLWDMCLWTLALQEKADSALNVWWWHCGMPCSGVVASGQLEALNSPQHFNSNSSLEKMGSKSCPIESYYHVPIS